ncbi:type IV secretion protein DotU [Aeromonas salmonicida subsp. salmonicida]|uniref:type IVB secretion system protein IcmH/DotU n=1 Tax=Aeromonas salmonicida TaxID=645 RepID=UPI000935ECD6|nr:type IVB secretion system protein IcmH/DotU [Aeromonas salmonicida]OKB02971.1 type IV secretion protein DotU [Aeromonas salmonicida subsp. salmonicida]
MTTDIIKNEQLSDLLFDHAEQLDMDSDYWFRLRGQSINPMIDAVTPLLGLVQRVRLLSSYDRVPELYQRVVTEIQAIEQELMAQGYENGVVLSFRYILCTFIDEAVMGRDWGSQSEWSEHSLLTRFHNETWGGEKVFVLLARLQEDPVRYRDILEFIYLCLCLGFEGRDEFERIVKQLHKQLAPETSGEAPSVFHLDLGRQASRYRLRKQISLRSLFMGGALILAIIFGLYHHQLNNQTQDVLRQLGELLK